MPGRRPLAEPAADRPSAVLSLNAEPLLYALVNAHWATRAEAGPPATLLDPQSDSLSSRTWDRIPYYYVHGQLPIPGQNRFALDSRTKLVFSETSYHELANASFSWQASAFISTTSSSTTVFIGTSMTDPNLKRWLAWQHAARLRDLGDRGSQPDATTRHYWLRRRPESDAEQRWLESIVSHLGLRIVWLPQWTDAAIALRRMLNIDVLEPDSDTHG